MNSAEAAGPRFAPEDPTLPKPWKGLVDGTTGILYYWNPETNITQYEKPSGSAPPLPPGPPPSVSILNTAPGSMDSSLLSNSTALQPTTLQVVEQTRQHVQQQQLNQPMLQQQLPAGRQVSFQQLGQQTALHHAQHMPYHSQQLNQHQTPQQYPQLPLQQMPNQQAPYVQGQIAPQPQHQQQQMLQFTYHQVQQTQEVQTSYQQGQQAQGLQIQNLQKSQDSLPLHDQPQSQGSQIPISQGLQMPSQQPQHLAGLQGAQQKTQQLKDLIASSQRGQQLLTHQPGFSSVEKTNCQDGKFGMFPLPGSEPQVSFQQGSSHIIQPPQQPGGRSLQNSLSVQLQQVGTDPNYHQQRLGANAVPNQLGHSIIHPSIGPKMVFNDVQYDRSVNEPYSSGKVDGSMMFPQHPKLADLPLGQTQDARVSHLIVPLGGSGGMNVDLRHPLSSMYNHTSFPDSSLLRSPMAIHDSSGFPNVSATDAYRQHHEVTASDEDVPAPFMTFEATGFPPEILREMLLAGFTMPTPIQAQTWPVALQSRDIVAIAKTGSGKTLGYLIPAFMHLRRCRNNPHFGPTVLVLAPTRELASQIQDDAFKFGRSSRVSCVCIYGGAPKGPQLKEIERGADIVVATPGRLNDFLEMKKINFHQISLLVLDEADRMLDMGFEPQIRKIVNEIPPYRQTLMYTATWPKEVRKISGDLLKNPVQINIGSFDELAANKSITQYVEVVAPMDRQRRLEQILRTQERGSKIIIFCSTKRLCDQLARSIGRTFGAAAIHGDKSQGERDHVLNQFRTGRQPILVATDVAAQGLDIKDIRVVINYDFPTGIEDYVHRIGRTGRAGATGVSYTFFSDQDWKYAADLVKVLEGASQRVPPEIREMAERGGPFISRPRGGMNRWDSGGGDDGCRWDGGHDMRDRPGDFGGRGGRNDLLGGCGLRERGFGGSGGPGDRGRYDRGPHDRYLNHDTRNRYNGRTGPGFRNKDQSYSRSPERVRTWGYSKRRKNRSWSRSRSRPGSSRSRSRSRSWSRGSSRSRSRSRSFGRFERQGQSSGVAADHAVSGFRARRRSGFDEPPPPSIPGFKPPPITVFEPPPAAGFAHPLVAGFEPLPVVGFGHHPVAGFQPPPKFEPPLLSGDLSPMSPVGANGSFSENEPVRFGFPERKNILEPVKRRA